MYIFLKNIGFLKKVKEAWVCLFKIFMCGGDEKIREYNTTPPGGINKSEMVASIVGKDAMDKFVLLHSTMKLKRS